MSMPSSQRSPGTSAARFIAHCREGVTQMVSHGALSKRMLGRTVGLGLLDDLWKCSKK